MKNIFDQYWKRYDAWYDNYRFAYLSEVEAIKKVLPRKGKGLEVGVGTGRFASVLGIHYGIDPSVKMVKVAESRGIDAKIGQGKKLPYKDKKFDFCLIAITICFVKEPEKVISEAKRVLKNKGKIILAIVDKDSFLGKFYQQKKSIFYKKANFFSVKEARALLRKGGFNKFSFHQTIFNLPEAIKTIETPMKGHGKGGFVVISGYK
ncbi:MAG: SAM-dependent methyltransferase [bacterium (Candidatus Ratteibacteria) CG_4_9_14_3_um_filter_41_21]|uniref:SAM-dependent methyltransferase n=4 Tax=Candidatus Ratteibacteria TaxID=2979319 RepID=A0A2M7YGY7_9BACT|nr:MAG: SAM-dependent methyltransferase [bacterium (Candidatus Ratteibacteria) CG_4_9_14_3_um_filter_41_21]